MADRSQQIIKFRSYEDQISILKQMHLSDDNGDNDFKEIKQMIDTILNEDASQEHFIRKKEEKIEKAPDGFLETEFSRKISMCQVRIKYLEEAIEEKKSELEKADILLKRNEFDFISSLRNIRNIICKKAKEIKDES